MLVTGLVGGLLYGVSPTDPATFASVAVVLLVVALGACLLPAWRPTPADPVIAPKTE